jgi:hypothetical protein
MKIYNVCKQPNFFGVFTIVACTSLGVISPKHGIELKINRKMYESALGYGKQRAFKFPFP